MNDDGKTGIKPLNKKTLRLRVQVLNSVCESIWRIMQACNKEQDVAQFKWISSIYDFRDGRLKESAWMSDQPCRSLRTGGADWFLWFFCTLWKSIPLQDYSQPCAESSGAVWIWEASSNAVGQHLTLSVCEALRNRHIYQDSHNYNPTQRKGKTGNG